jgi:hypothetical protein
MKGITWNRDSHGLFDYETRHPALKQLKTETAANLYRIGCDLRVFPAEVDVKETLGEEA